MDLDGDGTLDMLSGSYWPGDLYLFRGKKEGGFEKGAILEDGKEKHVNAGRPWPSEDEPDMDSLAASPWAADIDADGDLDLLVGNIGGRVVWIRNDGTATKPDFSAHKEKLKAGGKEIRVDGDAGPIVVDWDADGKLDLLVGDGEGAVWYFHNTGERNRPEFAAGKRFVERSPYSGKELRTSDAITAQGMRAKVCATDYDGDGALDLLVGDFLSMQKPEPELSAEQIRRRDELRERQKELQDGFSELEKLGVSEEDDRYKALAAEWSAVGKELDPLEPQREMHGYVWFFRQKPAAKASEAVSAK